jgi:hypothetical protein
VSRDVNKYHVFKESKIPCSNLYSARPVSMVDVNTLTSLIGKTKLNTMGQLSVGVEGTGTGHTT